MRRSAVLSLKSMVCSSQPLASMAGNEILRSGGNACDAAVCIAAVLAVIEPYSTGLGGDAFALYFDASKKQVFGINGSGRAGKLAGLDYVKQQLPPTITSIPLQHGLSVTVPGTVQAWEDMLKAWGTMSMEQVLAPAIQFAEQGFPVSELTAHYWNADVQANRVDKSSVFCPAPQSAGEIAYNKDMAQVLRKIGAHGRGAFYDGDVAQSICLEVKKHGGVLLPEDLLEHRSEFVLPVKLKYGEVDVYECPPNGQGMVALMALDAFHRLNGRAMPRYSAEMLNLQIECLKTSFVDAKRYVADPAFYQFDPYLLLQDPSILEQRLQRINNKNSEVGKPENTCDTVSFQVLDQFGNSVSMVNSVYTGFGSGICPPGLGFSLQNRGCNFSLDSNSPNRIEGGKRPYHTIIPGMALQNGELKYSFTGMGGFAQPQNHLQLMVNLVDFGDSVQEAIDRPRFCLMDDGRVALEEGIPVQVARELEDKFKQQVYYAKGYDRSVVGRGQIIAKDLRTGVLSGGSDGRADGCAVPGI